MQKTTSLALGALSLLLLTGAACAAGDAASGAAAAAMPGMAAMHKHAHESGAGRAGGGAVTVAATHAPMETPARLTRPYRLAAEAGAVCRIDTVIALMAKPCINGAGCG